MPFLLHAGSPSGKSFDLSLQGRVGTACPSSWTSSAVRSKHLEVLDHLLDRAKTWNCTGVDAARMGRTAAKVENTKRVVTALAFNGLLGSGLLTPQSSAAPALVEHVAQDADASRLTFGPPQAFDAAPFLDPETRKVVERPISCSSYLLGSEKTASCIMDNRPFNAVETVVNRWLPSLARAATLASLSLEPGPKTMFIPSRFQVRAVCQWPGVWLSVEKLPSSASQGSLAGTFAACLDRLGVGHGLEMVRARDFPGLLRRGPTRRTAQRSQASRADSE